jgi:hypothetical protein
MCSESKFETPQLRPIDHEKEISTSQFQDAGNVDAVYVYMYHKCHPSIAIAIVVKVVAFRAHIVIIVRYFLEL